MSALFLASICVALHRPQRALELVTDAITSMPTSGDRWLEPELYRVRGLLVLEHDRAEAERWITDAIEVARRQSSASLELRAALSLHAIAPGAKRKHAHAGLARALSQITESATSPDAIAARAILEAVSTRTRGSQRRVAQ